jgi:hypothetical protein
MTMADLETALALIRSRPDLAGFVGERDEALVGRAEAALERPFPPTYRRFIREFGAGGFGSFECYGVIDDDFEHSTVPNGIWSTLQARRYGLPTELILVATAGYNGLDYALDTSEQDERSESPVVTWTARGTPREVVAGDFGQFLLDNIREQLDRAQDRANGPLP